MSDIKRSLGKSRRKSPTYDVENKVLALGSTLITSQDKSLSLWMGFYL
jgi:hypothetical protein